MKIFLASSKELNSEREYVAGIVYYLGRLLLDMNVDYEISLKMWEYLDSSVSIEHKQIQYLKALTMCDSIVVLFWHKLGIYTEIEFQTALQFFRRDCINVLFKDPVESPSCELTAFRDSLFPKYGISPLKFSSNDELRNIFLGIVFSTLKNEYNLFVKPTEEILKKYGLF